MAIHILAPEGASPCAHRASPTQQHFAVHNALSLAMLYLNRGDLSAAHRKAGQAMDSLKQLQGVCRG